MKAGLIRFEAWCLLALAMPGLPGAATAQCHEVKLTGSDTVGGDHFGSVSVAGDLLAVGASWQNSNAGAVYIFRKLPVVGWVEIAKLTANAAAAGSIFGEIVLVTDKHLFASSTAGGGAVHVFDHDGTHFVESATIAPADVEPGDGFGASMDHHGDTLVVGSCYAKNGGFARGAAYVFREGPAGWTQEAELLSNDLHDFDIFGVSVAIAKRRIVVGALGAQTGGVRVGAAYVFEKQRAQGWAEVAKLVSPAGNDLDFLGRSVAMSGNGTRIAAGADGDDDVAVNAGAVYVWKLERGAWTLETKLTTGDGASQHGLGYHVAMNHRFIASGSPWEGDNGAAWLYRRTAGGWTQVAKLEAQVEGIADEYGTQVAMDDRHLAVGAPLNPNEFGPGAAYLYTLRDCGSGGP